MIERAIAVFVVRWLRRRGFVVAPDSFACPRCGRQIRLHK